MRIDDLYRSVTGRSLIPWQFQLGAGLALILTGVTIVLQPMLLVLLLAGLIGGFGVHLVGGALRKRRLEQPSTPEQRDFDDYRDYHVR